MLRFVTKLKKIHQVGLREAARIFSNRMVIKRFAHKHRKAALAKKAAITWNEFKQLHPLWDMQDADLDIENVITSFDIKDAVACAEHIIQNKHTLFGQEILFEGDARWHTDMLLQHESGVDCTFDTQAYFSDIVIVAGNTEERVKDIRVVWELSRLHLLMPLGKAYAVTQDKKYVDYVRTLIADWCAQNPYLIGVNWVCPMEVGIRAINLLVGYVYFKHAFDESFRQQYICLLYDHIHYLEHTWEYYDGRTSNHYLSDLVGYFYLCIFFNKKTDHVVQEIIAECDKQIAADGMSYEGSTSYHVLVVELFSLFYLLCEQKQIELPRSWYRKLTRMQDAVSACCIDDCRMITIGDNDSGKVLWNGFSQEMLLKTHTYMPQECTFFEQFGLTIVRKKGWHLSVRSHAYRQQQPSGHFHNDVNAITLALNDTPILVDPGSYCYTASAVLRNYFRSASVHNAMSIKGVEPVLFDGKLFVLVVPESGNNAKISEEYMVFHNRLYEPQGLMHERHAQLQKNEVKLTDVAWKSSLTDEGIVLFFNFTFAPHIVLEKIDSGWLISKDNRPICILESDLDFETTPGWVSHNYRARIPTTRLCAEVVLKQEVRACCRFRAL